MSEISKKTCFVIGPISKDGDPKRIHADMLLNVVLKPVLTLRGYDVKRADEDARPGMINERMIIDILQSDLAIADMSFHNPNAFYELGLRHTSQKPVIHFSIPEWPLPFDNAGYKTIISSIDTWPGIEYTRAQLILSLDEIEKSEYKVSNPVSHAIGFQNIQISGDPRDKLIADLQRYTEDLFSRIRVVEESLVRLNRGDTNVQNNIGSGILHALRQNHRADSIVEYIEEAKQLLSTAAEAKSKLEKKESFIDEWKDFISRTEGAVLKSDNATRQEGDTLVSGQDYNVYGDLPKSD